MRKQLKINEEEFQSILAMVTNSDVFTDSKITGEAKKSYTVNQYKKILKKEMIKLDDSDEYIYELMKMLNNILKR